MTASSPVTSPVTPLPLLTGTGPADWTELQLGTSQWSKPRWTSDLFAIGIPEKVEGATRVEDALIAASKLSVAHNPAATGILQSTDGAFYVSRLGNRHSEIAHAFPTASWADGTRVVSVTRQVDALKAVVGGGQWARFSDGATEATPASAT